MYRYIILDFYKFYQGQLSAITFNILTILVFEKHWTLMQAGVFRKENGHVGCH